MPDIFDELCEIADDECLYSGLTGLCRKAADEIERLRGALGEIACADVGFTAAQLREFAGNRIKPSATD